MRPQWFATADRLDSHSAVESGLLPIPYETMWADDVYWMPLLLAGRPFVGRADFTKNNKMQRWWFAEKVNKS